MEAKNIVLGMIGFVCVVILSLALYLKVYPTKRYDIKIDYCDGFTSLVTTVESDHVPNDSDIREIGNYSFYSTYFDVCHITVLRGF